MYMCMKHTDTQVQKTQLVYKIIYFKLASAIEGVNKFLLYISLMKQESSSFLTVEQM